MAEFLGSYREAFEALDPERIAAHFAYPVQVAGETGEGISLTVDEPERWHRVLAHLVDDYRVLGVATAHELACDVVTLSPRLHQVAVSWQLLTDSGEPVYDFDACYTLVETDGALRICAVAHNELPRLAEALARPVVEAVHQP